MKDDNPKALIRCDNCKKLETCADAGECAFCSEFVRKDAKPRPKPDEWEE
ncbi:hypothetical protein LJC74_01095 [Eubacteriales bacterium OttesenSCG-928-A19]|nr:hypothetical protein [Eubacteriales bacterium OttesenSCG-928-A19]